MPQTFLLCKLERFILSKTRVSSFFCEIWGENRLAEKETRGPETIRKIVFSVTLGHEISFLRGFTTKYL